MLSIDFRLEAELVNGGNIWTDTGVIQRQTGETANYRAFYSLSSTDIGVFNNVVMSITLDDIYDNITGIISVILPSGASYTTGKVGTQNVLTVHFAPGIPAGQSGYIEFTVQSKTPGGPNGELLPSAINLSGDFYNSGTSDTEPFDDTKNGPSWDIVAENRYEYEKTVALNGDVWTPDDGAYLVEYQLTRTTSDSQVGGIGAWLPTSATMVDTLPVILGVTPEILYAYPSGYTVSGNQISWDLAYPLNSAYVGVRYPKEQIDAIGGLAAIGNVTNEWNVTITLVGDVEQTVETSVTHEILPVPPQIIGSLSAVKHNPLEEPYPGNGLYYNNGSLEFRYIMRLSGSNVIPDFFILKENYLEFTFEDDTTQVLTGEDFYWNTLTGNPPQGFFEYNTNLNSTFVLYPGIVFPSNSL